MTVYNMYVYIYRYIIVSHDLISLFLKAVINPKGLTRGGGGGINSSGSNLPKKRMTEPPPVPNAEKRVKSAVLGSAFRVH